MFYICITRAPLVNKTMDAASSGYWPKVGDLCHILFRQDGINHSVIKIVKNWPVPMYLIRSGMDGTLMKVFRHELEPTQRPLLSATPIHSQNMPESSTHIPDDVIQQILSDWIGDADFVQGDIMEDMETNLILKEEDLNLADGDGDVDGDDSDLDVDDLNQLDESVKCPTTMRSTKWALTKFESWQKKRKVTVDLATVTETSLGETLRKFYAEVRPQGDKFYSPGTLRGIRAGLHRALTSTPYNRPVNILSGQAFMLANRTLETMCKKWVGTGKNTHHPAIEQGDLAKLEKYFSNYRNDPDSLTNTFWFLLCYFFARRGREGFRSLTKDSFQVKVDDKGVLYLEEKHSEISKNWQGGSSSKAWDYSDQRGYGIKIGCSDINLVDVYHFFLSKLSPDNDALFQKPIKNWQRSQQWFGKCVLGKNKLGQIMKTISEQCEMSQKYTNHSVRATAITIMYQAGIDTKQICKLTKHKAEESLKHYINGQTSEQKRKCAEILSAGLSSESCSSVNTELVPVKTRSELAPANTQSELTTAKTQSGLAPTNSNMEFSPFSNANSLSIPMMGNQSFNFNVTGGTCNFHFNYKGQE